MLFGKQNKTPAVTAGFSWPAGIVSPRSLLLALLVMFMAGCSSTLLPVQDSAPMVTLDPDKLYDAIPRIDPVTRAGNSNPYTVLGKTYHLLPTAEGYREQGIASWYGTKFHGRPTANGEPYSLYAMTAAHKTLPIPAYVKVTNLDNGRTAIVRVNDRGPFHDDRIIDLSYAAAVKLGYADQGTARVEVQVITPRPSVARTAPKPTIKTSANSHIAAEKYFLQAGAFKDRQLAENFRARLAVATRQVVEVQDNQQQPAYYRVRIGPLASLDEAKILSDRLQTLKLGQPRLISE